MIFFDSCSSKVNLRDILAPLVVFNFGFDLSLELWIELVDVFKRRVRPHLSREDRVKGHPS